MCLVHGLVVHLKRSSQHLVHLLERTEQHLVHLLERSEQHLERSAYFDCSEHLACLGE